MRHSSPASLVSLFLGMVIVLAGTGLLGTLLGLRANLEGFGSFTIGLIMAAFFAGYVLGAFLCPPLIRRVGHIRTFAALCSLSAAVALLHGLLPHAGVWGLLRLIHGIAMIGLYMVAESWLSERAHAHRGQVFALYMTLSLLALAGGQWAILLYGHGEMASFALAAILFCLGLLPIALTRASQPAAVESAHLPPLWLFHAAPAGAVGAAFSGAITGAFWGLSAVYASARGLDASSVSAFISATIIGGALLQWPIGKLSDRHDRRRVMTWVALSAAACALAIELVAAWGLSALVAASLLYGGFSFSLYGLSVAQAHDRVHSNQILQVTQGLLLINGLGAVTGPIVAGLAMHALGHRAFPVALAMLLVALALYTVRRASQHAAVPEDERSGFIPVTRTSAVAVAMDPRLEDDRDPEPVRGNPVD